MPGIYLPGLYVPDGGGRGAGGGGGGRRGSVSLGLLPMQDGMVYPNTSSAQAVPLPILYGTCKLPVHLLDMSMAVPSQPQKWVTGTVYRVGAYISTAVLGTNRAWKCLLGGTSTSAPTAAAVDPDAWVTAHVYALGSIVQSTYLDPGGNSVTGVYQCTVPGTSGPIEPNGTGVDIVPNIGGPHWMYLGQMPFSIVVTSDGLIWQLVQQLPLTIYTQFFTAALCEGQAQGVVSFWWDQEHYASANIAGASANEVHIGKMLEVLLGADAASQTMPANFGPDAYQHTVLLLPSSFPGAPSGTKKEMPALAVELQGVMFGVATADVNAADIVNDILTHTRRGGGWPGSRVGASITGTDPSGYRVYCDAAGLRFSLLIDSRRKAIDVLGDILNATNSDSVWSGGALKIVPLGDQSIASPVYGTTGYVAANTAQYNLTIVDFQDKDRPVQVTRRPDVDCFNSFPVEYLDRSMHYQQNSVEDPDQTDIEKRGMKWPGSAISLPMVFPDGTYPIMLSRIAAQRSLNVRNTYTFRLPWRYLLLEPTDIVTLPMSAIGIGGDPNTLVPVRIVSMQEGADFVWTVTAEDYPQGVAASNAYAPQPGDGLKPNMAGTTGSGIPVAFGSGALTSPGLDNIWPNPTTENPPPPGVAVGNDGSNPEWDYRFNAGAGAHNGSWVRRITGTVIGSSTNLVFTIPCSPDDIAQFTVWAKAISGAPTAAADIVFLDGAGNILLSKSTTAINPAVWTMLKVSLRAPAGTVQVQVAAGGPASGQTVDFDDFVFRRISPAGPAGGFYSASTPAIDCTYADQFEDVVVTATDTVGAPTSAYTGQTITIKIKNVSGGAITITWNAVYKMAAWTNPANGFSRSITFHYDGSHWVEVSRTPTDVPN